MSILRDDAMAAPSVWEKGLAASDRFIFDLATRPAVIRLLRIVLGENIILWGATFRSVEPGDGHAWHSDIESSAPGGNFVTVWIGLENVCQSTALKLVRGSHRFGKTVQEIQHGHGFRRGEADDSRVLDWAREFDPAAEVVQPSMTTGDAILFDGALWHGAYGDPAKGTRTALLLQYARADEPVYMPDMTRLEWPFRLLHEPRAPVIGVIGVADETATVLGPTVMRLSDHGPSPNAKPFDPKLLFEGPTQFLSKLHAHLTHLQSGAGYEAHADDYDVGIVLLDGQIATIGQTLTAPGVVFYARGELHGMHNPGTVTARYVVFELYGEGSAADPGS